MDEVPGRGRDKLEQSLRLALEHGFEGQAARAYFNIGTIEIHNRNYAGVTGFLQEGLAFCIDHTMEGYEYMMRTALAQVDLNQGNWIRAGEEVTTILSSPER